mmetsp:Transcript_17400/g.18868  ORF Transcript_17400/g.18868 Transcript_17400/m.18868 type:complete len:103 (-) Transcript_17400:617-925(-)
MRWFLLVNAHYRCMVVANFVGLRTFRVSENLSFVIDVTGHFICVVWNLLSNCPPHLAQNGTALFVLSQEEWLLPIRIVSAEFSIQQRIVREMLSALRLSQLS